MQRREFTTAPPRMAAPTEAPTAPPSAAKDLFDPLRYCIFTTLALIAWVVGPVPVVAATSAVGVAAYWRARRAGLTRSRCVLGDTRVVMLYLALAFLASVVAIGARIVARVGPAAGG